MKIKKPMLAGTMKNENMIEFPVLASPKLDGFRCLKLEGKCLTRSFKPIGNKFVRGWIEAFVPDGLDGELMLRDPKATFNQISSELRRSTGEPDFVYHVFDWIQSDATDIPFDHRYAQLVNLVSTLGNIRIKLVPHIAIESLAQLNDVTKKFLEQGFEGAMIRSMDGPYKQGRSTEREGFLLKIKPFEDSEAVILGFEELMHNHNEKRMNELGKMVRSSHKAGKVPGNTLGKFLVRDLKSGVEFAIGTGEGLTHELRQSIWNKQDEYLGELIKYKYQAIGTKDKPRSPIFLGFRAPEDL